MQKRAQKSQRQTPRTPDELSQELTSALETAGQESEAFVAEMSERASALEAAREAERTARQELSSSEDTLEQRRCRFV